MRLTCGCCGDWYSGKQDTDHDRGFGLCPSCEKEQAEQNDAEWDKAIKLLADALGEKNREDFLVRPREEQIFIVDKAIKDGILTWKIGG